MNSIINHVYNLAQEEEFRKHVFSYISMNSLINYVYEFGSGRGKLHKHINVTIFNEFLKYMFTSLAQEEENFVNT